VAFVIISKLEEEESHGDSLHHLQLSETISLAISKNIACICITVYV